MLMYILRFRFFLSIFACIFFDFFHSVLIFVQNFQIVDDVKCQCMFCVFNFFFLSMFARTYFQFFSFCFDLNTIFSNC